MTLGSQENPEPEGGFDAFYTAHYGQLASALRMVCADPGAAEDITQDALYRALVHWPRVQRMSNPGGWLYVTALRLARRHPPPRQTRQTSTRVSADDLSDGVSRRADLTAAIRHLPEDQRAAVVARHVLGFSTDETAIILHRSPAATRALLHRAVTALRADRTLLAGGDQENHIP